MRKRSKISLNSGLNIEKLLLIQQNQPGKFKTTHSKLTITVSITIALFFFGLVKKLSDQKYQG